MYSAILKYHQRRNCFGYIQLQYNDVALTNGMQANAVTPGAYTIIRCENSTDCGVIQVFAPNDHCCYTPKVLLVNKIFADLFGLRENEEVIVQRVETAPVCSSFDVELISAEDWNIVQNSSQRIEELLLEQIQLITVGQTYPVWIAQNLYIYFTVVRIKAFSSVMQNACLCEFTEVHVKPFYSNRSSLEESSRDILRVPPLSFACRTKDLFSNLSPEPFMLKIQDYCGNILDRTAVRVLPKILINDVTLKDLDILAVFKLNFNQSNSEIITLSIVRNDETGRTAHALLIELPIACSRFATLRDCLKRYDAYHCAFSPKLHQVMSGEYEWIKVSPLPRNNIYQLEILEVLSEDKLSENFNECLRNHLWKSCRHYPIIVPVDGLIVEVNLTRKVRIQCRIRPHLDDKKDKGSQKCFVFTNDMFPPLEYPLGLILGIFRFQIAFIEKCCSYITYHLEKSTFFSSENILIVGNKSTGKTTILHFLAGKLLQSYLAVYSECLYCSEWNGKSIEKFQDVLKNTVTRLRRRYPSVLFLDDLDILLRGQDEDVRNVRLEKCAELVRNLATENDLLVIATACTKHEVVELFSLNTGGRFFGHVEGIKELSPIERAECLEKFCNQKIKICSLQHAVETTGKCTISDLKRLAQRIILELEVKGHEKIEDNVEQALREFQPIAVPFEQLKPKNIVKLKWEDVGGLKNVKKIITEVFIWPTKYPLLYRNISVRLGRGVLLHGPSGCGKTLICRTLAAQWDFNVISIKGPELLSKFIGESEENVRKIFGCARVGSPCLIFFDEFDSLGPKRGESDTGVTDRVVNQLLTELDGVEGLDDVYIIGATNRIDLIDSSLLRPGRFDYIVKCELPNMEERMSILEIFCRGMSLKNADFEVIARATHGWTGADLKGLVTNAQLIAHKRIRGALGDKDVDFESTKYVMNQEDLLFAVKESQPNKNRNSSGSDRRPYISPGLFTTLA
uniref:Peroxisomal ATPase PEX1 n=2 Tax=Wuchereria bancrofti TaxID=6293 RepID=A0AAF5PKB5_WUCBA